jgi:hypothetical protein
MSNIPSADPAQAAIQQLLVRVQRLEDHLEIQKLQAKYAHYLFTQKFDRIFEECFAKHVDDVSLEFSDSGVYRGMESVRALYAAFAVTKNIPGYFILHMAVNPYIEIAADGLSARSHWLSPGASGTETSASWIWGPYYVDYVREEGAWRIAHSNLAPLFRNRYETSWAAAPDHGSVRGPLTVTPDEPSTLYRPYSEVKQERDIFKDYPELPEAY